MRQTYAIIKPSVIADNLKNIKQHLKKGVRLMAVIKADAYGHGASSIAPELVAAGADAFGVASIDEAVELRQLGISIPILILGATGADDAVDAVRYNVSMTVWYPAQIEAIRDACIAVGKKAAVHLKIDTGMGRLGVRTDKELIEMLRSIEKTNEVELEGVFTHFATADEADSAYFSKQIARFQQAVSIVHNRGFNPLIHAGNSAVTLHFPELHFDMVRPGFALYGYDPGPDSVDYLHPAMQWESRIVNLKWVQAHEGVSYGATYHTDKETLIATVPVGYADGYRRSIGNSGYVLVKGNRAPVIGRVCMDQMMIDVTNIPGIELNDKVVLLGEMDNESITANEMGSWQDTIGYEVLCAVGKRVPRFYE